MTLFLKAPLPADASNDVSFTRSCVGDEMGDESAKKSHSARPRRDSAESDPTHCSSFWIFLGILFCLVLIVIVREYRNISFGADRVLSNEAKPTSPKALRSELALEHDAQLESNAGSRADSIAASVSNSAAKPARSLSESTPPAVLSSASAPPMASESASERPMALQETQGERNLPHTLPPRDGSFIVIGDFGHRGNTQQRRVALTLAKFTESTKVSFIASSGDNFYPGGVSGVTDVQFRTSWRNVYTAPSLQLPWLMAIGNHDYKGSVEALEEYSEDSRWSAKRHRKVIFPFSAADGDIPGCLALIFIDTTTLVRSGWGKVSGLTRANGPEKASAELDWLNSSLSSAAHTCAATVVIGHHPGVTCGKHSNTEDVRSSVFPLLLAHGADVYISGHDHHLAHLTYTDNSATAVADGAFIDQIVSGGGSLVSPAGKSSPFTVWHEESPGFTVHKFNATHGQHTFIHGATGAVIYSFTRRLKTKAH